MPNVFAVKSGNWSDTTLWNTGSLPTVNDDVFANNFTVYVDNNYQVKTLRNLSGTGIAAGGQFILNNQITLSSDLIIGSGTNNVACVIFLSASPSFCTVYSTLSANNPSILTPVALQNSSSGTINIFGSAYGGRNNGGNFEQNGIRGYVRNTSTGIINISGTEFRPGTTGANFRCLVNESTGTLNISGNVFSCFSLQRSIINIEGNVTDGIVDVGRSFINVIGNVLGFDGTGINTGGILTVRGTVSASNLANGKIGINCSGQTEIFGDVYGGWGSNDNRGITNTGTLSVYGNVFGNSGTRSYGIQNGTTGIVYISGNAVGGSNTTGYGVYQGSAGTTIVYGNIIGGTGSGSFGGINELTGYMEVNGLAIGNGWGLGSSGIGGAAPGIFGSQTGITIIRGLSCGPRGQWPTAGNVFIIPQSTSTATLETSAFQDVTLFTALSTNIVPPVSSVRQGTIYNLGDYTGTCRMPSVSSVLQGVAVDNSIGIAALRPQTIWNYSVLSATDVNSLGGRLKEVATVQSVGQQLTALN